jgi:anti-sigma factor RsiW
MNCECGQQSILLSLSGELPAGRDRELRDHLASCSDCRRYLEDAKLLSALAVPSGREANPSLETIETIMEAGQRAVAGRHARFIRFPDTRWLAAAAGFMLLAAGSCLFIVARRRGDAEEHGARMSQLHTIMAMVSDDETVVAEAARRGDTRPDIQSLARQILRVEGLTAEEAAEEEDSTPVEDAQPRDLQSGSTFGSLPGECA